MPIFCRINVHLLKNTVLHVIYINFFMKKPLLSCPCLVKIRLFCQNYTILWAIKVNRIPFFPIFYEKNQRSYAHICKKRLSLSIPYFINKTSILSDTLCSHVNFFNFFIKNHLQQCSYFTSNLSKQHCMDYGPKKSIGCIYVFSDVSWKNYFSHAHILSIHKTKLDLRFVSLRNPIFLFYFHFYLKMISMFPWWIIFQTSPGHCLYALDHLIWCAIFFFYYNLKKERTPFF